MMQSLWLHGKVLRDILKCVTEGVWCPLMTFYSCIWKSADYYLLHFTGKKIADMSNKVFSSNKKLLVFKGLLVIETYFYSLDFNTVVTLQLNRHQYFSPLLSSRVSPGVGKQPNMDYCCPSVHIVNNLCLKCSFSLLSNSNLCWQHCREQRHSRRNMSSRRGDDKWTTKKKDVYMQHEEIKVQFNSMLQYRPSNIFVHKSTTAKWVSHILKIHFIISFLDCIYF